MANFSAISGLNQALVRKSLTGGLISAPYSTVALTRSNLFATDGTLASPLPTGYASNGTTTDDGIRFGRSQESEDITGWQFLEPVRSDRTSDVETIQVDFLETKRSVIEMYSGADLSAATYVNKAISIQKPALPTDKYYRVLTCSVDNVQGQEAYYFRFYPRAKVTTFADQAFAKSGALQWGVTLTAYVDPVLGYSKDEMYGGPGFALLAVAMGFSAVS